MLIILGGLPASGKTTIARALAQQLGMQHLRIDSIEQAMRDALGLIDEMGPAGYLIAYAIAADNLRLGQTVIADSVNPLSITRNSWREVALKSQSPFLEIELICSDSEAHRLRIETRCTDISGLRLPTWQEVLARDYEPWTRAHLVFDTTRHSVADIVKQICSQLESMGKPATQA